MDITSGLYGFLVPFSVSAFTFWRTRGSFLAILREQELGSSLHIKNIGLVARASTGGNPISTSWVDDACGGSCDDVGVFGYGEFECD